MRITVGLLLAFGATGCFAASYIGQHFALSHIERLELRRPLVSLRRMFSNRRWLIGNVSNWVGWGLYIAALAFAPLSLVQAITASTIGLLALATWRSGRTISSRERAGALLAVVGLVLVLVSTRTNVHSVHPSTVAVLVVVGALLAVAGIAVGIGRGHFLGVGLAVASGCCYGAGDVATKAAVLGATLLIPVFVACIALGFVLLQMAYQRASLLASAGLSALLTNAIPIVAGVVLFGETTQPGLLTFLRAFGFVAVVVSGFGLAGDLPPSSPTTEHGPAIAEAINGQDRSTPSSN